MRYDRLRRQLPGRAWPVPGLSRRRNPGRPDWRHARLHGGATAACHCSARRNAYKPAARNRRERSIIVRPDLAGLFSARLHVPRIVVEHAYVSVWRTRDGKLRLLPSLLEKKSAQADAQGGSTAPPLTIGSIVLRDGALEFFDATVRQPAHKTRLEQLHVTVDDLRFPALDSRTKITMDGMIDQGCAA